MRKFSLYSILATVGVITVIVLETEARVGGGDSYGGGSRGGSSRGSGSGDPGFLFDIVYLILRLCFRYPVVGIPCLIALMIWLYYTSKKSKRYEEYYSSYGTEAYHPVVLNKTRDYVEKITQHDPNFSFPIFKDFIFSLYHTYHETRGSGKLDSLSAFFDPKYLVRNQNLSNVEGVVIGNCTISKGAVNAQLDQMTIEVGFSANYTEIDNTKKEIRYKISETWRLRKSLKALSKAPEKMTSHACPNCGAPLTETVSAVCRSCNQSNKNGRFLWFVYDMVSIKEELKETTSIETSLLSSTAVDYGVHLPTIKDPNITSLVTTDRDLNAEYTHLKNRAEKIFIELQKAWTQKNWNLARPYETDTLFHTHLFWIEDFRRKGQTNFLGSPKVERLEPVSVMKDNFYMSFTFRIYAQMLDYTIDKNNKLIRGNRTKPIQFSEYWTFIKGINANQKDPKTQSFHLCPSCGAELKISMGGVCEFCGSKITLGQFDWVLSQIEQDEEFAL